MFLSIPNKGVPGGFMAKESTCNAGDTGSIPSLGSWLGRSPGGGHGSPPLRPLTIPWTEEPGGLQSIGSHRNGHKWSDWARTHACQVNNLTYYSFLLGCFGFMELRLILCHLSFEKNNFSGHHFWHFSVLLNGYWEVQHAEASLMRCLPWQGEKCHLAEAQVLSKWEFCLRQQKQRTDLG